jgi:hypothetical protein
VGTSNEYKRSTQKLINNLVDKAANHTDMKIMETIVKDEHDLVNEQPMNHVSLNSVIGSTNALC